MKRVTAKRLAACAAAVLAALIIGLVAVKMNVATDEPAPEHYTAGTHSAGQQEQVQTKSADKAETAPDAPKPGPVIQLGRFTNTLAGGKHLLDCSIALELIDSKEALTLVQAPRWMNNIRSEILMLIQSRKYEELSSEKGHLKLAGYIKRSLNMMLPKAGGREPIMHVLFERMILQ